MNLNYTVRSIYFDTAGYRFFYEKLDGLKFRKKVRLRTYNENHMDKSGFIEIKRKRADTVFKERTRILLSELPQLLARKGVDLSYLISSHSEQVFSRFIYLYQKLQLKPKVLITYEREAFQALDDPDVRVTMDLDTRSYLDPDIYEFFRSEDMRRLNPSRFILEIKFNGNMPSWCKRIVRDYHLHLQPISKYCSGIEAWMPRYSESRRVL